MTAVAAADKNDNNADSEQWSLITTTYLRCSAERTGDVLWAAAAASAASAASVMSESLPDISTPAPNTHRLHCTLELSFSLSLLHALF